jgi:uncharacterized protein YdeI (YjbR/CyaY-like superfamily)
VKLRFFRSAADFRSWLDKHHASATELWVGYHRKASGRPSMTWPESVDEALCFGWIDGIRKRVNDTSYTIRFTPRRATSIWSAVNIARVKVLKAAGAMRPAGIKAFAARRLNKSGIYSYEQRPEKLPEPYARMLRAQRQAWTYFSAQTRSYQRAATWWIVSAKKEETRLKRFEQLARLSALGQRIPPFDRG